MPHSHAHPHLNPCFKYHALFPSRPFVPHQPHCTPQLDSHHHRASLLHHRAYAWQRQMGPQCPTVEGGCGSRPPHSPHHHCIPHQPPNTITELDYQLEQSLMAGQILAKSTRNTLPQGTTDWAVVITWASLKGWAAVAHRGQRNVAPLTAHHTPATGR